MLAVHQREGRMRWLEKSVGEPIARGAGQMTLFIPYGVEGFVSRQDGSISLQNILIPVTSKPRPEPGVEAAARLIRNLELPCWHGHIAPRGTRCRNAFGEAPRGHRLDLESRGQGPANRLTLSCKPPRSFARI